MQINISGHHVEVTQALKDYVHSKVEKLERHFDNITNVQVTLTVEKATQKAEATMHVSGAELHANADNDDMYAAIDGMTDKLDRQLLKHKEKMVNHRHGSNH
ncbi:MAG: putative sigma-54 modulation protein [Oceanicoccus sp.]|jgi:putative sigma-54 modulation protein